MNLRQTVRSFYQTPPPPSSRPTPLCSYMLGLYCTSTKNYQNYEKETSRNKELRSGNRDDRNLLHRSTSFKGKPADFLSFHPARLLTIKFTGSYPGIYKK